MSDDHIFKQMLDPKVWDKSKESICKGCKNNLGWNGEFYDCKESLNSQLEVKYEREGLFHSKIIKCNLEEKP